MRTPRAISIAIAVLSLLNGPATQAADSQEKPNFVVIMADDLGYGDLSCYGDPGYETPHLDRLAKQGLRFTDYHSNGAVCSPTRAALLTGRYQQRADVDGVINADPKVNRDHGLHPSQVTFAEVLHSVGYVNGIFGKWHLGYDRKFNPVYQGFDQFRGYVSGNVCYHSHLDRMGIADWWRDDQLAPEEGYTTHLITKHAIDFIEQHKDSPFCCYVAHEAVHSPFQGPDDPAVRVKGMVGEVKSRQVDDIQQAYAEMAIEMDKGVGEIVAKLHELGLEKNTLVMYFSDNGANSKGNNAPLRGFKGSLWEGGHRVPCIAYHPGKIKAGTVTDETAMSMDIMPTLVQLADASGTVNRPLDGVSLVPLLYEQKPLPDRDLFWKFGNRWAVRRGDWKLVNMPQGRKQETRIELFNLQVDVGEENDLSASHPDLVKELSELALTWQADVAQSAMQEPSE